MSDNHDLDLGNGHYFDFTFWEPSDDPRSQYAHLPKVEKYGGIHYHPKPDGSGQCEGAITFEGEVANVIDLHRAKWKVVSWEPLTLSPSLLCRICGSHGFIRDGKWINA